MSIEAGADNQAATPTEQTPPAQAPELDGGQPVEQPLSVDDQVDQLFQKAMTGEQQQETPAAQEQQGNQEQKPANEQPPQEGESQQDNLILGKFKNTEDVFKGYTNLEADYTKKSQALSDVQKASDSLKGENTLLQAKLNELQNATVPTEQNNNQPPQDETKGLDSEAFLNEFYEKPQEMISKTIQGIVEKSIKEGLKPIEEKFNPVAETVQKKERQEGWDEATREFYKNNSDMAKFRDGMKQYIQENNLKDSNNPEKVLKDAYTHARGLNYHEPQAVDIDALLKDPNFVTDKILSNESIRNEIINKHMQSIKDSVPPMTITGQQGGGQPPAAPRTKPKNMEEADEMTEKMLRGSLV